MSIATERTKMIHSFRARVMMMLLLSVFIAVLVGVTIAGVIS